jgi:hypothetical protein
LPPSALLRRCCFFSLRCFLFSWLGLRTLLLLLLELLLELFVVALLLSMLSLLPRRLSLLFLLSRRLSLLSLLSRRLSLLPAPPEQWLLLPLLSLSLSELLPRPPLPLFVLRCWSFFDPLLLCFCTVPGGVSAVLGRLGSTPLSWKHNSVTPEGPPPPCCRDTGTMGSCSMASSREGGSNSVYKFLCARKKKKGK